MLPDREETVHWTRNCEVHSLSEDTKPHKFSKTTADTPLFSTKATEQHQLKKQIHNILQHVRRSGQTDIISWPPDILNTWERATQNETWNMHTNMTIQTPTSWVILIKNLQRAIRGIDQYDRQLIRSGYKVRRKRFTAKLADDPAGGREFQAIRESPARPVQFLVDKEGILHTDQMKTDNIMTKACAEVHNGTDRSDEQVPQDFRVTDITVEQLRDAFRHIKNNAAGPDAWEDITLSKHTDTSLRWLATMLNEIEKGMKWPRQTTKAHATCIPKESQASHDPLAYRVLLIMSQIYRKWASMRLKHLAHGFMYGQCSHQRHPHVHYHSWRTNRTKQELRILN